jgi:hypothetical protein
MEVLIAELVPLMELLWTILFPAPHRAWCCCGFCGEGGLSSEHLSSLWVPSSELFAHRLLDTMVMFFTGPANGSVRHGCC